MDIPISGSFEKIINHAVEISSPPQALIMALDFCLLVRDKEDSNLMRVMCAEAMSQLDKTHPSDKPTIEHVNGFVNPMGARIKAVKMMSTAALTEIVETSVWTEAKDIPKGLASYMNESYEKMVKTLKLKNYKSQSSIKTYQSQAQGVANKNKEEATEPSAATPPPKESAKPTAYGKMPTGAAGDPETLDGFLRWCVANLEDVKVRLKEKSYQGFNARRLRLEFIKTLGLRASVDLAEFSIKKSANPANLMDDHLESGKGNLAIRDLVGKGIIVKKTAGKKLAQDALTVPRAGQVFVREVLFRMMIAGEPPDDQLPPGVKKEEAYLFRKAIFGIKMTEEGKKLFEPYYDFLNALYNSKRVMKKDEKGNVIVDQARLLQDKEFKRIQLETGIPISEDAFKPMVEALRARGHLRYFETVPKESMIENETLFEVSNEDILFYCREW